MTRKAFLFILLLFSAYLPIYAQSVSTVAPEASGNISEIRLQTFEKVWNTVNEKHFDPTFGGVDWKKAGETFKPKALSAATDDEFYAVLQEMLGELKQSHFGILPPNAQITSTAFGEGEIGIDIQFIDKQVVVSKVAAASPAEKSGLKTGFIIKKVDGKTIAEILAVLESKMARYDYTESKKNLYRERAVMVAVSGKVGTSVNLEILNAADKPQNFQVARAAYDGEMSAPLGNFPAQRVIFESRMLPDNIGYIRFNIWVIPQMIKLRQAIASMSGAKGIIFDLRANPGGVGAMAPGIAGLLVEKETSLGTMKFRSGESNFKVFPQQNPFGGKIKILTDYATGSTSEVFAAGMQEIGRAKVVGETTAGAVLPSVMEKLPTGALFQYAISDYKSPNKILIEGRGVKPDIEINLTRQSLLEGRDLQMETAIKEILRKK